MYLPVVKGKAPLPDVPWVKTHCRNLQQQLSKKDRVPSPRTAFQIHHHLPRIAFRREESTSKRKTRFEILFTDNRYYRGYLATRSPIIDFSASIVDGTVQRACESCGRTLCRSRNARITKTRQERDDVSCKVRGRDNRVSKTSQKRANLKLVGLVGVFVLVALHVAGLVGYILSAGDTFPLSAFVESLLVRSCVLAHVRESVHRGGRFSCLKIK